jgi:hypothetical protein
MNITLQSAARAWWRSKRPLRYTLENHLASPAVNCTSESERALAREVADTYKTAPQRAKE